MRKVLFLLLITSSICFAQKTTVYTIGDSTMAEQDENADYPGRGWAQMLEQFFTNEVTVENRGVSGRSSRSYINENRWDLVYKVLVPGDYVIIQFGHNDQKETDSRRFSNPHTAYCHNLIHFVKQTREKGAIPILLTSISGSQFNDKGTLINTLETYSFETRLVAQEFNMAFIDVPYFSEKLEELYGQEKSKELHLHYKPGEIKFYPDGVEDNVHLSSKGATEIARVVATQIQQMNIPLGDKVRIS
ncbi:rhamnogalacturonan acetylesterase [Arenibacter sp. F26102]|uniref:rhamnogalacturonan acetylesterase n=1 Tax=Arenibacter sp. F26102 TaxID=2926416 RepID=UPI001FF13913|nr:rhamnogalacturonan acetylesterase [Arenibacter sp. F26102]MCK0148029.1 rhamnogalacturonan acetylesterase [Arenibacter sp. F26102]